MIPRPPQITPFVPSHTDEVVALWQLCFAGDPGRNEPRAYIAQKIAYQPEFFLVAIMDEVVVGTIVGGYDGVRGWMYHLATHPAVRRRKVATQLVRDLERRLKAVGCVKLNLQIRSENSQIAAFYASLGYEEEARLSLGKVLSTA